MRIPSHPAKGSPAAYAWARKMKRLRDRARTATRLTRNPRERGVDPTGARELYLYATNNESLYRSREIPIIKNLLKKWNKGTYDHEQAKDLWVYWADDAAKRYAKEYGSTSGPWHRLFNPATRYAVAEERADFIKGEFELGNYRLNPGARWHEGKSKEADQLDQAAHKKWQQDFYHGKSVAHSESALAAKAIGMNPKRRISKAMLVYQAGIANVFKVTAFNLADYGRDAVRLYQGDFRGAENFARGLATAGTVVRTAAANKAGDITHAKWTDDLDAQPFSDKFHPVNENPRRPPKRWFQSCVKQVRTKSRRARRPVRDPHAVCGALWHQKASPTAKREAMKRERKNPIAIYGLSGNPARNGKVAGLIYPRVIEIKAQKTRFQPGYYRHTFPKKSQVQIFGLDNGDLLLHSKVGVKLWKPA